jgi:hypothetical protein
MVEKDYGEPILQVASGCGLANAATSGGAIKSGNDVCMVFLQSRKLVIATVNRH